MAKKQYTPEQQAAYWKKKALAKTSGKGGKKAPYKRKTKKKGKRSGCKMVEQYTNKAGQLVERPSISGWRITPATGFQSFTAYLGANNGEPKNSESRERYVNFVVTMVSGGHSTTENAVYDKKYRKLKFIKLGLVANPFTSQGDPDPNKRGYFGPGGARLKGKATKSS